MAHNERNTHNQVEHVLRRVGLNEKEIKIYLTLIEVGPSPVRTLAVKTGINRGTTYEVLKSLIERGLVSYFHKTQHQYFTAEDPSKIRALLELKTKELLQTQQALAEIIPFLTTASATSSQPRVRFFEGTRGIRSILEDVLTTMAHETTKEYRVYSSADVRDHLYVGFRNFVEKRIRLGIKVKTIAMGPGGKLWGLDERRWLPGTEHALTYQMIYGGKLALISLGERGNPVGTIVEDERIAKTQRLIFEGLWATLPSENKNR